jgi:hypothetical protein
MQMKLTPRPDTRRTPAAMAPWPVAAAADGEPCLSAFDMLGDGEAFAEPLRGMQMRELLAPGIFRRFFGAGGQPAGL